MPKHQIKLKSSKTIVSTTCPSLLSIPLHQTQVRQASKSHGRRFDQSASASRDPGHESEWGETNFAWIFSCLNTSPIEWGKPSKTQRVQTTEKYFLKMNETAIQWPAGLSLDSLPTRSVNQTVANLWTQSIILSWSSSVSHWHENKWQTQQWFNEPQIPGHKCWQDSCPTSNECQCPWTPSPNAWQQQRSWSQDFAWMKPGPLPPLLWAL